MSAARRAAAPKPVPAWPAARIRGDVRDVPLGQLEPDPGQPRRTFDEAGLDELAGSLRELGQLQPIRVTELPGHRYRILCGERRWRAAERAGLRSLTAVVVGGREAGDLLLEQLAENAARQDLGPIEEAEAYRVALERTGHTHLQIATAIGVERTRVTRALALLELPEEVRALVAAGELAPSTAGLLRRLPDEWEQIAVARLAAAGSWSRAEAEASIARRTEPPPVLHGAPAVQAGLALADPSEEPRRPGTPSTHAAPAEGSAGGGASQPGLVGHGLSVPRLTRGPASVGHCAILARRDPGPARAEERSAEEATMSGQLVLSLFPGIGLLDRAFEEEGWCVVRGPDVLWGGDVRRFRPPPGRFDGVIGGPPCQAFSRLAHMVRHNGHAPRFGNLIPEFERCCYEAQPQWWLMEEVPDAPIPLVEGYETWSCLLNNRQLGEVQHRLRRWSFGARERTVLMIDTVALEPLEFAYAATGAGRNQIPVALNPGGTPKRGRCGRVAARDALQRGTCRSAAGFAAVKGLQGLPDDFDLPPFTVEHKVRAVANGVPLAMGRALARAVREATSAAE